MSGPPFPAVASLTTSSARETYEAGRRLGAALRPGSIVLLHGELGTGKTVFVKGLAAALDVDPDAVTSPTFTIVQEYPGRLPLHHVDLYRLTPGEVDDLGLDEIFSGQGIVAVEWPERLSRPVDGAVVVRIADLGGERRRVSVDPDPASSVVAES